MIMIANIVKCFSYHAYMHTRNDLVLGNSGILNTEWTLVNALNWHVTDDKVMQAKPK